MVSKCSKQQHTRLENMKKMLSTRLAKNAFKKQRLRVSLSEKTFIQSFFVEKGRNRTFLEHFFNPNTTRFFEVQNTCSGC